LVGLPRLPRCLGASSRAAAAAAAAAAVAREEREAAAAAAVQASVIIVRCCCRGFDLQLRSSLDGGGRSRSIIFDSYKRNGGEAYSGFVAQKAACI
jgi:hypothetical protein